MRTYYYVFILAFLFFACKKSEDKNEEKETVKSTKVVSDKPVEVKAMLLETTDFSYELISNGTVIAKQKANLKFQSSELIERIYVKNGDRVSQGQKIAQLDQFKLNRNVSQSKDNFERAKLDLQDILIGQGYAISDSAKVPLDILKIAKIKCNYDQSRVNYELAARELEKSVLRAPFSGVVANLFAKEHNYPDNDPFCTIVDNGHPEVVFMILESELESVRSNDKVLVSPFAHSEYTSTGQITEINPMVDKNGMVRVKALVDNKEGRLFDGMNVKVKVQRLIGKQLVVPKTALVLRSNKKVIFTLKNNQAQWVYVETGPENSTDVIVTDGLHPGDSVIYEGNVNLAHESPVEVKDKR